MSYQGIDLLSDVNSERGTGYFDDKKSGQREAVSVIQMFEEQVNRTPDASAIIFDNRIITYQQFNHKANHLAHFLRRKGVGPGSIVTVMTERSLEMVQGIFGVLKAGGTYLPMNPFNPMERTRQMLADCQARILLTQEKFIKYLEGYVETVINLEDPNIDFNSSINPDVVNKPSDLVYVIYTSGSTGLPRGVMIEHVSLVNRLNWMQKNTLWMGVI